VSLRHKIAYCPMSYKITSVSRLCTDSPTNEVTITLSGLLFEGEFCLIYL
jgi:hypothetical protein